LLQTVEASLGRFACGRPLRVCVGYSGGLDSTVLLHLAAQVCRVRGDTLSAVHVHHGLSSNADAWAAACSDYTAALGVPLTVARVHVDATGQGVEAAARAARYAVFEALEADVLLLAHHRGDQAETVLFNVLRGSGIAGLAGVPVQRALRADLQLLRPLLAFPRAALHDYAVQHGLPWVEDESNADTRYRRNFLRQRALPLLADTFPAVETALVRVADHMAEAQALLAELSADDLACCVVDGAFDLAAAAALTPLRRRHALRGWLKQHGVVVDARAFDEWLGQLDAPQDGQPALVWRERAVRRFQQRLYVTPAQLLPGPITTITTDTSGPIPGWQGALAWLPQAGGLNPAALLAGTLELRPRPGNVPLRLHPDGPSRPLKLLFQEYGIPPWQRAALPLLYLNGELAAVPGIGVAAQWQAQDGVVPVWQWLDAAAAQ
jgi:tRNA(Ile)-lysidine synthase